MDKRVMLAVAGAGKTYYICNIIDVNKRNLILAFTNENIHNIQAELIKAYGCVPENTMVMTFDSFIYRCLICPFEPSIAEYFSSLNFHSTGITTIDPPPQRIPNPRGGMMANPLYQDKTKLGHYVSKRNQYYCATLSELVMQVKKGRESLIKKGAERLNLFFDHVLIDEFQDFREHDYDLIIALSKRLNRVLLVGDYYQHSVSAVNNSGKPFKVKSKSVSYMDFVEGLKREGFDIDDVSLNKSRRCSNNVCRLVQSKLGIHIESTCDNQGSVIWLSDPTTILGDPNITKLVYSNASKYSFQSINWSYSKGDTFDAVCVILTDSFENMENEDFSIREIASTTINKLYVAMTRSKGNLYLVKASTFKGIKDKYVKQQ